MSNRNFSLRPCCSYCFQIGHSEKDCRLRTLHKQFRKSNIPQKYWDKQDPIKCFLLNQNIKSNVVRRTYENLLRKQFADNRVNTGNHC